MRSMNLPILASKVAVDLRATVEASLDDARAQARCALTATTAARRSAATL